MTCSSGSGRADGDLILVPRIRTRCLLGVSPRERRRRRLVEVTLAVEADLGAAAASDDIEQTVDYSRLARLVRQEAAAEFRLVEALAGRLASAVLALPRVRAVEVTVSKPRALRAAGAPQVVMRRQKG